MSNIPNSESVSNHASNNDSSSNCSVPTEQVSHTVSSKDCCDLNESMTSNSISNDCVTSEKKYPSSNETSPNRPSNSLSNDCVSSEKKYPSSNETSPNRQPLNDNVTDKTIIEDALIQDTLIQDTLSDAPDNSRREPLACDDESCVSSNDSLIEMNTDNLSIDSVSSDDSRKQESGTDSVQVPDITKSEISKALEARNAMMENEITQLRKAIYAQEIVFKKAESKTRTDFLSSIEKLSKECNTLRKDKETMVIRYANSEKEVIKEKKVHQELEKKLKDILKERDSLLAKVKHLNSENSRLSALHESKMVEIAKVQKNFDKLNSDFNAREIRIKWLQNNLKTEMNSHQETQTKLDHTTQRLNEMKEEAEQVRKDCQEMIKCYQEGEETKSVKLDCQLKQKQTELEVQKQEKSDQEQVYLLLRQELEALKKKQRSTMEENSSLTLKIHNLEKQRLEYEQNLSKHKDSQNTLKQEVVDLTARLAEMETLHLQLEREKEKSNASLKEVERLRSTNAELQSDMNACHVKEGELLKFTEGVTDTNVKLQSAYSLLEIKAQALEDELTEVKQQLADFQEKYFHSVSEMEKNRKEHEEEGQLLARKLAEKIKNVEKLNMKLDESENENRVLKRRHIASIKELSRELQECKRRLDGAVIPNGIRTETSSLGSRTSSAASLDVISSNEHKGSAIYPSSSSQSLNEKPSSNEKIDNDLPGIDKEMLIEKIIKLQKQLVAKNERIDFLKDHIVHLVKEMKKKCKCDGLKAV